MPMILPQGPGRSGHPRRPRAFWLAAAALPLATFGTASAQERPRPSQVYAPPADDGQEIVVTGAVTGGDLFPVAPVPKGACLAAAPALGAPRPGFAVDGTAIKGARGLEKLRKKTRRGTIFVTGGKFAGERFAKAQLSDICFFGSDFSRSDWRGFAGSGLGFVDSNLSGANLTGARFPFVLLRDVTMAGADATGGDWSNGRLDGGWKGSLKGVKLDRATLRGFRIECGTSEADGCPVEREGLSMRGTDLTKASVYPLPLPDVDMAGAIIDQTEMGIDHLGSIGTAKLNGAIVVRSKRRATMFFPAEAQRLSKSLDAMNGRAAPDGMRGPMSAGDRVCANPASAADRAVCAIPGSEMKSLISEVATLEAANPAAAAPRIRRGKGAKGRRVRTAAAPGGAFAATRAACLAKGEDDQDDCLLSAYRARRIALLGSGGRPSWLGETGPLLFVSADVPVASDEAGNPIFDRLRPIMLDAAQSVVMLNVAPGGGIEAKGHANGGCAIAASGMTFNAANGSIGLASSRSSIDGAGLLTIAGDQMRVLDGGLSAVAGTPMGDAVYCKRGASFATMRRVRLETAALAELWERF